MTRTPARFFARNVAAALLAGDWEPAGMRDRARRAWGSRARWVDGMVNRTHNRYPAPPAEAELVAHLLADERFGREVRNLERAERGRGRGRNVELFWVRPAMVGTAVPTTGPLPDLPTTGVLADWLGLTGGQLTVYADVKRLNRFHRITLPDRSRSQTNPLTGRARPRPRRDFGLGRTGRDHPYYYRWVPKRGRSTPASLPPPPPSLFQRFARWLTGQAFAPGPGHRLLEIPKTRLKRAQRRILDDILGLVPPHPAAHAFRPRRSVATNAAPHCGRHVVLRFDLSDFFASVPASRVKGVFLALGYPPTVARLLAGLCTTVTPGEVWERYPGGRGAMTRADHAAHVRLDRPHLPQGAPTSPALANLCAFRLDGRLAALAAKLGANYTRYADDLTFSGGPDLRAAAAKVRRLVTTIAGEEGFAVNVAKSRVTGRGRRQVVAGVVVNDRPNVPRTEFDALKATLTNCVRRGPSTQNRGAVPDFRAHLTGKVAHVAMLNPARGAKLRAILDRIDWTR